MTTAYHFAGAPRLAWPFDTPNQLGLAGAAAFLLALGGILSANQRRAEATGPRRLLWCASVAQAIATAVLTAATYSRGAWVGIVAGSLALGFLHRRGRATVLAGLGFFLLVCALLPAGAQRLASMTHAWEEGSIANRFTLWKGALAIMWDHPARGVGFANFRETYAAWYQPAHMHAHHHTALNDFLTLGACAGWPALWVGCTAAAMVFALGADALRLNGAGGTAGLLGAWITGVTAAQFSAFGTVAKTAWIPLGLTLGLVGTRAWLALRGNPIRPRLVLAGLGGGSVLTLVIVLAAAAAARSFAHRPLPVEKTGAGVVAQAWRVEPRSRAPRGEALVVTDDWAPERDARRLLRGLAAAGFRTSVWRPEDLGFAGAQAVGRELAEATARAQPGDRTLLIGLGAAGRLALAAAVAAPTPPAIVATLGTPAWFALPELSPAENVRRLRCPLLVLQLADDPTADPADARRLVAAARTAHRAAALALLDQPAPGADPGTLISDALIRLLDTARPTSVPPGPPAP